MKLKSIIIIFLVTLILGQSVPYGQKAAIYMNWQTTKECKKEMYEKVDTKINKEDTFLGFSHGSWFVSIIMTFLIFSFVIIGEASSENINIVLWVLLSLYSIHSLYDFIYYVFFQDLCQTI